MELLITMGSYNDGFDSPHEIALCERERRIFKAARRQWPMEWFRLGCLLHPNSSTVFYLSRDNGEIYFCEESTKLSGNIMAHNVKFRLDTPTYQNQQEPHNEDENEQK